MYGTWCRNIAVTVHVYLLNVLNNMYNKLCKHNDSNTTTTTNNNNDYSIIMNKHTYMII